MTAPSLSAADGRRAFGDDPAAYDTGRPAYPNWVFDRLTERGALPTGAKVFEIGPGAGLATRELVARGAGSVLAIEPDVRLAAHLEAQDLPAVTVVARPFEEAELASGGFDLGIAFGLAPLFLDLGMGHLQLVADFSQLVEVVEAGDGA